MDFLHVIGELLPADALHAVKTVGEWLASGVIGFVVGTRSQLFAWLKEEVQHRQKAKRAAVDAALHLLSPLTTFVQQCADRAIYNEREASDYADAYNRMPSFPQVSTEALPPGIAAKLRLIPNAIAEAHEEINFAARENGPLAAFNTATNYHVGIGRRVVLLLDDLRGLCNLGRDRCSNATFLRSRYRRDHRFERSRDAWIRLGSSWVARRLRRRIRRLRWRMTAARLPRANDQIRIDG